MKGTMVMSDSSLFSFMHDVSQDLVMIGEEIERKLYTDPFAVLVKARIYSEQLIKLIWRQEKLTEIFDISQIERLQKLSRMGIFNDDIFQKFNQIRRLGNVAAHESRPTVTVDKAIYAHRMLYDVSVWYQEVYGSIDFQPPEYRTPTAPSGIDQGKLQEIVQQMIQQVLQQELAKLGAKRMDAEEIIETDGDDQTVRVISLTEYLTNKKLEIIDNRKLGGALWIVGGWELNEILFPLKKLKIYFRFTSKGGRATKKRPAWYLLGKQESDPVVTIDAKTGEIILEEEA
jgi:hypothetical protein